ncbi:hypothetical protein [Pseudomonas weihenstephanensis]|uniref:hypothetical protein n=1 Tax=Pseudomonas weihenstephanensis TaxID=1608994 RepID=UPI000652B3D4|nr:hypothetical protein [Pseudomonas weihenstephanensis]KMN17703.1 hypothetical protein TU87_14135 [Pseudomonas weihenstephanensis]
MHPSIAQRITVLDGLRARTRQATNEFYQKPNMIAPALAPRYIVKPSGNNTFDVIERSTGKIIAERFGHNNATGHARELEAKAKQFNVKQFGKLLSRWTLRIGITLTVFAFFSSHM